VKKHRLTWSKEPHETGLARVCEAPRGKILKVDGVEVASVNPYSIGFHEWGGWYFCARNDKLGVLRKNSCVRGDGYLVSDFDTVRDACEKYVRECLEKAEL